MFISLTLSIWWVHLHAAHLLQTRCSWGRRELRGDSFGSVIIFEVLQSHETFILLRNSIVYTAVGRPILGLLDYNFWPFGVSEGLIRIINASLCIDCLYWCIRIVISLGVSQVERQLACSNWVECCTHIGSTTIGSINWEIIGSMRYICLFSHHIYFVRKLYLRVNILNIQASFLILQI